MVSDGLARDGVEIHLNTEVASVRMEGGRKVVELVIDGNVATTTVDQILTGIGRLPAVQGLDLEAAGIAVEEASIAMVPKNLIKLEGKQAAGMLRLNEALEEHDDVLSVYSNFDIDEKELESLSA